MGPANVAWKSSITILDIAHVLSVYFKKIEWSKTRKSHGHFFFTQKNL